MKHKPVTELFFGKFASVYTPVVFVLAIFVTLHSAFTLWCCMVQLGLSFIRLLVVACPCGFVSTPVTIVSA